MNYTEACKKFRMTGCSRRTVTLTPDGTSFKMKWEEPRLVTVQGNSDVVMIPQYASAKLRKKDKEVIIRGMKDNIANYFLEAHTEWERAGYPKEFKIIL